MTSLTAALRNTIGKSSGLAINLKVGSQELALKYKFNGDPTSDRTKNICNRVCQWQRLPLLSVQQCSEQSTLQVYLWRKLNEVHSLSSETGRFLYGGLKSDLSFDSHIEGQAATFDLRTLHKPAVHALIQIPRSLICSPRPAAVLYRIASAEFEYLVSPERQCSLVKVKCL